MNKEQGNTAKENSPFIEFSKVQYIPLKSTKSNVINKTAHKNKTRGNMSVSILNTKELQGKLQLLIILL